MNLGPKVLKSCSNSWLLIECFGGQYAAVSVKGPCQSDITTLVAWILSVSYFCNSWWLIDDLIITAVPPWAVPSGCLVSYVLYPGILK